MNPGIREAFWSLDCCPFPRTCVIYPDDPQNAWLARTSSDELGHEEDKIAPPFVVEVHWGVHCQFTVVSEGPPVVMSHLGQVRDTLQVP
jgi:hypothetical protein